MSACQHCRAPLSDAELESGRCSHCGQEFAQTAGSDTMPLDQGVVPEHDAAFDQTFELDSSIDLPAFQQSGDDSSSFELPKARKPGVSPQSIMESSGTVDLDARESGETFFFPDNSQGSRPDAGMGTVQIPEGGIAGGGQNEAGRTMPLEEGVPVTGPTVEIEEGVIVGDGGKTIPMENGVPVAGGQTMQLDEGDEFDPSAAGRTMPLDDMDALDLGAGQTMPLDDSVDLFTPVDTVQLPDAPEPAEDGGGLRTMPLDGNFAMRAQGGATIEIPDDVPLGHPAEIGAMRTMQMDEGVAPPRAQQGSSQGTPPVPDRGDGTMPDISRSALLSDEGSPWGSGSGSPHGSASGSSEPDQGSRQTFVSDEFSAKPDETAVADGTVKKDVDQVLRTMWMEADADANPGMTLRARKEEIRPAVSPGELIIKNRVLRKKSDQTAGEVDYELEKVLGEGGMGTVWQARQTSINRHVALKMLKGEAKDEEKQRLKFLAEAVVTGDLDHPNIVPIYDVGRDEHGALFYSMKKVEGTPWNKAIGKKSLSENIDILLKVSDAVAFAHDRGVIHRDLKPENVMIGSFGEVLVMDWGLAHPEKKFRKSSSISRTQAMGGTPAYMAPEMATGPMEKIGEAADVYLLGAILYEIVTGRPPHGGNTAMKCLMSAARNEILPTEKTGELMDIAYKCMATSPSKRYAKVGHFQQDVKVYLSHTESIGLAVRAEDDLNEASVSDNHEKFQRAIYGFEAAIEEWGENDRAKAGLSKAKLAFAKRALRRGDYDAGIEALNENEPAHRDILKQLKDAVEMRNIRQRRLKQFQRLVVGLAATILVGVSISAFGFYLQNQKVVKARDEALTQKGIAEDKEKEAKEQRLVAENKRKEAEAATAAEKIATEKAVNATKAAVVARDEAKASAIAAQKSAEKERLAAASEKEAKKREQYEAYVARIGLAAEKIKENAFDSARELLDQCKPKKDEEDLRNWEWGRLMHLCSLNEKSFAFPVRVGAVRVNPANRTQFLVGTWGGVAQIFNLDGKDGQVPEAAKPIQVFEHGANGAQYVNAVAWSPTGEQVVTAGSGGRGESKQYVQLWDVKSGSLKYVFKGHTDDVTSVVFSKNGDKLLTASYDNTARLWDVATAKELSVFGQLHRNTVWSADFDPTNENRIVTASEDETVRLWSYDDKGTAQELTPPFMGHSGPVYSAVFTKDGSKVVSGGYDQRILVWDPAGIEEADFAAIANGETPETNRRTLAQYQELRGHRGAVRSVSFDKNYSKLLSCSEDNTVRVWNVPQLRELNSVRDFDPALKSDISADAGLSGGDSRVIRGHDTQVRSCCFVDEQGEQILSASFDQKVNLWKNREATLLRAHKDEVLAASFNPRKANEIVTASRDRTARIWNTADDDHAPLSLDEGHAFLASRVVALPELGRLLTSAGDGTVRLWNSASGAEVGVLRGTGANAALAVHPQRKLIATGGPAGPKSEVLERSTYLVQLWDLETLMNSAKSDELIEPLYSKAVHDSEVSALEFSPDGSQLMSGDGGGAVVFWNVAEDGKSLKQLSSEVVHIDRVSALAYLPNPTGGPVMQAASASNDGSVARWDTKTGKEIKGLNLSLKSEGRPQVLSMAVTPDGRTIITGSADGYVRLWDANKTETYASRLSIRASQKSADESDTTNSASKDDSATFRIDSVAVSADGSRLLAVDSGNNTVHLWDVKTGTPIPAPAGTLPYLLQGQANERFAAAAFATREAMPSNDSPYIVTVGGTAAQLWTAAGKRMLTNFKPHLTVAAANFSPDGSLVVTAGWDQSARLWDVRTGKDVCKLSHESDDPKKPVRVNWATFAPSSEQAPTAWRVLTACDDNSVRVWEIKKADAGHQPTELWRKTLHAASVQQAVYSADGKWILTASRDKTSRILLADSGAELCVLNAVRADNTRPAHNQGILSAAFSADGRRVVTGGDDNFAFVWSIDVDPQQKLTAKVTHQLLGHTAAVNSVALAAGRILTGSADGSAKLWDVRSETPAANGEQPAKAGVAPEETIAQGKEIMTLQGHDEGVTSVQFSSPDGREILTGSRDGRAIIWRAEAWDDKKPAGNSTMAESR